MDSLISRAALVSHSLGGYLFLAMVCLCGVLGLANLAHAAAPEFAAQPMMTAGAGVAMQFAVADFDGDEQPDCAAVKVGSSSDTRGRYWIEFQLSTGVRESIGVTGPKGGLQLSARDVNGDSYLDVVISTLWLHQPVAVLLNDGHGNFELTEPAAFPNLIWDVRAEWSCVPGPFRETTIMGLAQSTQEFCVTSKRGILASIIFQQLWATKRLAEARSEQMSRHGRDPPVRFFSI
jgi:hypothetical protein